MLAGMILLAAAAIMLMVVGMNRGAPGGERVYASDPGAETEAEAIQAAGGLTTKAIDLPAVQAHCSSQTDQHYDDCVTVNQVLDALAGDCADCSNLTYIYSTTTGRVVKIKLHKKGLKGHIPVEIGSLEMLQELWLYTNELTGTIPSEMGNLANLTWLFVSDNDLSGQIPETLNNLSLDRLWLHKNSFTGCVPYNLTLTREYKVDSGLPACAAPTGDGTPTPTVPAGTPTPPPVASPTPTPGSTQPTPTPSGDRLTAVEGRLTDIERRVTTLEADVARLLATPTPTPVPTPGATPTPTPSPTPTALGTQQQPVPFGTTFTFLNSVTDHWEFTVLEATPNATSEILNHNQFNDPPASGNQFYMVKVRAKYLGTGSERFRDTRLKTLGDGAVVYAGFGVWCGVIPDSLPEPELFTNGQVEGNRCWEVASSDADSLVLFVEPYSSYTGTRFWFSLSPP